MAKQFDIALICTGLLTLLATAATTWLGHRLSPQGDVQLPKELLTSIGSGVATVFLGLCALTFQLWRRDLKAEAGQARQRNGVWDLSLHA